MEQIRLASSGRETTRLGYGCSSIMGALGRRQSLRLLEAAYDTGIRHFDVAPMYGYKSCKWLSEIRVTAKLVSGYWERLGYDQNAWVGRSNGY